MEQGQEERKGENLRKAGRGERKKGRKDIFLHMHNIAL